MFCRGTFCRGTFSRGIGIGRVVIDRTNNHAPRPRHSHPQRSPLQCSSIVARLQITHFPSPPTGNPFLKLPMLGKVADRRNPSEIKSRRSRRFQNRVLEILR